MKHLNTISRVSRPVTAETTPLEAIILAVVSVYFRDWDNFRSVVQNLQKYYSKT